ncbi:MAG: hypothetical protein HQL86_01180 [Magnetococcales bacterium]|nr:hypothetical protein [Magnetococcales bacterium]
MFLLRCQACGVRFRSPEMVVKTWQAGNEQEYGLQEREIIQALRRLDPVWRSYSRSNSNGWFICS